MHISEYIGKTFLVESPGKTLKSSRNLVTLSKNAALPKAFFSHVLRTVPKAF